MTSMSVPATSTLAGRRHTLTWLFALIGLLYLVLFEQGTLTGGLPVLHESFHDARHLLGFPCH